MNNKRYFRFLLSILFLFPMVIHAQSWKQLTTMSEYITGEGAGETEEIADQAALKDLISKICVIVESQMAITEDEQVSSTGIESHEYFVSKVNTYSDATLTNTEKLILHRAPRARVGRFMLRSEVDKIFEGRQNKVNEYIRLAQLAEERLKIDDALRYYYWAYTLLKTLQYPTNVTYTAQDGETYILISWIPYRMNEIFDKIRVSVESVAETDVLLTFTYNGQPITSIDYIYFNGRDWSNVYSAKDGRGFVELRDATTTETLQLRIEYAYVGQAHIDRELETVINVVKSKPLTKSFIDVRLKQPESTTIAEAASSATRLSTDAQAVMEIEPREKQKKVVDAVINAIAQKNFAKAEKYFTKEGLERYHQLLDYGQIKVLPHEDYVFSQYGTETLVRGIPVAFSFNRGVRTGFVEDLVFSLNKHSKIDNIAFGLEQDAMNEIMNKTMWSEETRQTLVTFLENYKTAFAFKRLDYLKSIFSNDAIIIVGHVVKKVETVGDGQRVVNKYVTRTQLTKEKYMENLARCFQQQEFVNIRFGNSDVMKAQVGGELYGIQIKQDYYSTGYGDTGYLYLQVDFNHEQPLIRVRTWQEAPDPELMAENPGSTGIYGMQNF